MNQELDTKSSDKETHLLITDTFFQTENPDIRFRRMMIGRKNLPHFVLNLDVNKIDLSNVKNLSIKANLVDGETNIELPTSIADNLGRYFREQPDNYSGRPMDCAVFIAYLFDLKFDFSFFDKWNKEEIKNFKDLKPGDVVCIYGEKVARAMHMALYLGYGLFASITSSIKTPMINNIRELELLYESERFVKFTLLPETLQ